MIKALKPTAKASLSWSAIIHIALLVLLTINTYKSVEYSGNSIEVNLVESDSNVKNSNNKQRLTESKSDSSFKETINKSDNVQSQSNINQDFVINNTTKSDGKKGANQNNLPVNLSDLVIVNKPDTDAYYPIVSKKVGEEGTVELRLFINESGNVDDVDIIRSSKITRLDIAAQKLAKIIQFKPFIKNNTPIKISATITINFKLKK